MGVHGIARDLAAAGLGTLKAVNVKEIAGAFPCPIEIRTDDPEGCPAFYGRVIRGVKNGPSPDWLQQRLKAVGPRPISAPRSEERRVGKECVSTCRSRWSKYPNKKKPPTHKPTST